MSDFALANKLASFKPKGWDVLPEPGDGELSLCGFQASRALSVSDLRRREAP